MSDKTKAGLDRRSFMGAAATGAGAAAAAGFAQAAAPATPAPQVDFPNTPGAFAAGGGFRAEVDIRDCEVEGKMPLDLNGVFYRVGPDPQYPKPGFEKDIPFDGEGHVSMFRIKDGHVDLKTRFVRNQRFKAQAAARKSLWGMYRNPMTDDPSVKNLSGGTANTHLILHHDKLLVLKEDSPPVAMDPWTLDTTDDYYTFGGKLTSKTFTAHPKLDPRTGHMIAFGYEARGFGSDDLAIYEIDAKGKVIWETYIKVPYVCMIHDFGVSDDHIAFLVIPLAINHEQMKAGGVHWAYDSALPSYFGVVRRGGDGKDARWLKGPERMSTHVMGSFGDGKRIYVDMDMGTSNQFPFFPNLHGERFNPVTAAGKVARLSIDTTAKSLSAYDMELKFDGYTGGLPRQDDRYNTQAYRYGFMLENDPKRAVDPRLGAQRPSNAWYKFDHQTGQVTSYFAGGDTQLQEMCFAPKSKDAPEGAGYLVGVANRIFENRSDFLVVDAEKMELVSTVKLPFRIHGQIHGWWAREDQLPAPPKTVKV
jgi:carotenoid cleavage dioxygenase